MNKRKSKKQKRLEVARLLESLEKHGACAVAMVDNSGCAVIMDRAMVEMKRIGVGCYTAVYVSGIVSECAKFGA